MIEPTLADLAASLSADGWTQAEVEKVAADFRAGNSITLVLYRGDGLVRTCSRRSMAIACRLRAFQVAHSAVVE